MPKSRSGNTLTRQGLAVIRRRKVLSQLIAAHARVTSLRYHPRTLFYDPPERWHASRIPRPLEYVADGQAVADASVPAQPTAALAVDLLAGANRADEPAAWLAAALHA